jgi:uncharacterized membrane protein
MIFLFWGTARAMVCESRTKERKGVCFEHSYWRLVLLGSKGAFALAHSDGERQHGIPKACMALLGVLVLVFALDFWTEVLDRPGIKLPQDMKR